MLEMSALDSQRPPWAISNITECFHGQRGR